MERHWKHFETLNVAVAHCEAIEWIARKVFFWPSSETRRMAATSIFKLFLIVRTLLNWQIFHTCVAPQMIEQSLVMHFESGWVAPARQWNIHWNIWYWRMQYYRDLSFDLSLKLDRQTLKSDPALSSKMFTIAANFKYPFNDRITKMTLQKTRKSTNLWRFAKNWQSEVNIFEL